MKPTQATYIHTKQPRYKTPKQPDSHYTIAIIVCARSKNRMTLIRDLQINTMKSKGLKAILLFIVQWFPLWLSVAQVKSN